jgi:hypothetical protein
LLESKNKKIKTKMYRVEIFFSQKLYNEREDGNGDRIERVFRIL